MNAETKNPRTKTACPICGKPAEHAHRPFCSARCAQIDLGRWLNESYRVLTEEEGDVEDGESA